MGDRGSAPRMKAIGITQRATPLTSAWMGELRVRFTDFQVNEITPDGSVLRLHKIGVGEENRTPVDQTPNSTDIQNTSKQDEKKSGDAVDAPKNAPKEDPTAGEPEKEEPEVSPEDIASLTALAGEKFAQDVAHMFKNAKNEDAHRKKATAEPTDDKSKRGKIHHEVRRIFDSKIETSTDESGAIVATLVSRKGKNRGRGGRNNRREEKPAGEGEYLYFTLYKDNRDTMDAVNQVARLLRVKPQNIGYAGTKDRRASTVQRCSVRYIRPRSLAGINSKLRSVVTGDYQYAHQPVRLGQLLGNEFVITIKGCKMSGENESQSLAEKLENLRTNVQSAVDHMAKHGWINYFGHQRFGTHHIGTHEIGKLILGETYEDAVNALLAYDPDIAEKADKGEAPDEASSKDDFARHQACMLFLTGKDPSRAAQIIPRRFGAEVCLLRHLNRDGKQSRKDYVGALIHITRGLRSMYLHAYQSHVWNHAASRRWELHGNKVIKGDLVLVTEPTATNATPEKDQDGDDVINPTDGDDGEPAFHARPLTEEEAAGGQYTIHDVVLPSPGYDVIYPDNDIGAFYAEFMAREENGSLDPHKMRRIRREFSLPGRYRKLMNRFLAEPSVEFRPYVDETEQMQPTDLDRIRADKKGAGKRAREEPDGEPASKRVKGEEGDDGDVPMDGLDATPAEKSEEKMQEEITPTDDSQKKIAAVVKFQLGSSAYATVTLRELMGDPPENLTSE